MKSKIITARVPVRVNTYFVSRIRQNDFHYISGLTARELKLSNFIYLSQQHGPDLDLDLSDSGDDVQRRFYYQNTYAAIACCAFLQGYPVKEIYCEHHEDILVKFNDDTFEGIQVKTKALHLPGFSFSDEAIQKAILKFVRLELAYPGKFKSFKLVTNTSCLRKKGDDLNLAVSYAKESKTDNLLASRTKTKKCINEIAKKLKCTTDDVIRTISKIVVREQFSNLNDDKKHLVEELGSVPQLSRSTLGILRAIAEKLISTCYHAGSKANEEISECYLLGKEIVAVQKKAILDGKRITPLKVSAIIKYFTESPVSHFLKDESSLNFRQSGTHKLELKMDAGGIDNANINLLKDFKYSFESFSASWLHKYDSKTAIERYNQLQLIINSECQEAFDESRQKNQLFGADMLMNLRRKLRERITNNKQLFLDCDYEHLLGLVGVLTEDCKVWWSDAFKIEEL